MKKLHNRKYLKGFRKELRNNPTKAESMLWKALRKRGLDRRKFRRQHSIGKYIVDFYCPAERLIIELEGAVHNNPVNEEYDFIRMRELQMLGLTIIHFQNEVIFSQLEMVLDAIRDAFST